MKTAISVPGEIFEQAAGQAAGYDGGRPVTVYVPPGPPEAVVFAGDGQLVSQWGAARWADALRAAGATS